MRFIIKLLRLALFLPLFVAWPTEGWALEQETGLPRHDPLSLELEASRRRIYLGEAVQVSVTLRAAGVPLRNVGYPKVGGSGFGMKSFGLPEEDHGGGESQLSYRFTTTVTPTQSGLISVGPAELECEEVAPASGPGAFFGGTELRPVLLRSPVASVEVVPLPAAGRPADFSGAVGRFSVTRSVTPVTVRVGEPMTVRTVIRGEGNIRAFSCDGITAPGVSAYPPTSVLARELLNCEQVVIPEKEGVLQVPEASLPYFDPRLGKYRRAISSPTVIRVNAPASSLSPSVKAPATPAAATRPTSTKEPALPGLLALLIPAGLGTAYLLRRRRRIPSVTSPVIAAAQSSSPGELCRFAEAARDRADVELFYTLLFRAAQGIAGERLGLPPAGITSAQVTEDLFSPEELCAIRYSLTVSDAIRYGKQVTDPGTMEADLRRVKTLINQLPSRSGN